MLPPIPVPDAAARLSAMAQQATLAPIQQAAAMRAPSFQPPPTPQEPGLMAGVPAFARGVADIAGAVKQGKQTDAMAQFVRGAIGDTLPEGATPVEGMPWLQQQGGALPPVPPAGGAQPASLQQAAPPAADTPAVGGQMPTMEAAQRSANPFGFDRRQVAILKGLVDSGDPEQIARAGQFVMMKAFEKPAGPDSPLGKLISDYKRFGGDPAVAKFYEQGIQKETAAAPAKAPDTREVKRGDQIVTEQWDPSTQKWSEIGVADRYKPASTVVNVGAEKSFDKKMGEEYAKDATTMLQAGRAASGNIAKYERLGAALKNTYTGTGGEQVLMLKKAGRALGFDVGDVSDAEAAQAIGNRIAMELRNPAGGAGMPGAMSDKDREFLVASVPGLGQTPQGNAKLVDYMIRLERRNADVAKLARGYMSRNDGRIDQGFYDELAAWSEQNPLFSDADARDVSGILGSSGSDSMSPSAPGTSATLPPMGLPKAPSTLTDQELLEQLRQQGYQIPRQ